MDSRRFLTVLALVLGLILALAVLFLDYEGLLQ
jgi:hypothetical protein